MDVYTILCVVCVVFVFSLCNISVLKFWDTIGIKENFSHSCLMRRDYRFQVYVALLKRPESHSRMKKNKHLDLSKRLPILGGLAVIGN